MYGFLKSSWVTVVEVMKSQGWPEGAARSIPLFYKEKISTGYVSGIPLSEYRKWCVTHYKVVKNELGT